MKIAVAIMAIWTFVYFSKIDTSDDCFLAGREMMASNYKDEQIGEMKAICHRMRGKVPAMEIMRAYTRDNPQVWFSVWHNGQSEMTMKRAGRILEKANDIN